MNTKRKMLAERVMRQIAKPPVNEGMIAADLKVKVPAVRRVVAWAVKEGYAEHVEVPGWTPHLSLTKSGIEWLHGREPGWWMRRNDLTGL